MITEQMIDDYLYDNIEDGVVVWNIESCDMFWALLYRGLIYSHGALTGDGVSRYNSYRIGKTSKQESPMIVNDQPSALPATGKLTALQARSESLSGHITDLTDALQAATDGLSEVNAMIAIVKQAIELQNQASAMLANVEV